MGSFFPFLNLDICSLTLTKKATFSNSEKFRKNGNSRFIIHGMLTRGIERVAGKKTSSSRTRTLPLSYFLKSLLINN